MPQKLPFALYDCFSSAPFGGSQAMVVSDAAELSAETRERIAEEVGMPATAFVASVSANEVEARFLSTVMELPMCGHGTLGLMTRMTEQGALEWKQGKTLHVSLKLPAGPASVEIRSDSDGRPLVMLEVRQPDFRDDQIDKNRLCNLLGLKQEDLSAQLPVEVAAADFIHLIVPVKGLAEMRRISPDFSGLVSLCHDHGLETVVVMCSETERPHTNVHVRDFCPAVGVPESAAAGTTNAAISSYFLRHGQIRPDDAGKVTVLAEQGIELNRPSEVRTDLKVSGGQIESLKVGGVATKVAEGHLLVPSN